VSGTAESIPTGGGGCELSSGTCIAANVGQVYMGVICCLPLLHLQPLKRPVNHISRCLLLYVQSRAAGLTVLQLPGSSSGAASWLRAQSRGCLSIPHVLLHVPLKQQEREQESDMMVEDPKGGTRSRCHEGKHGTAHTKRHVVTTSVCNTPLQSTHS